MVALFSFAGPLGVPSPLSTILRTDKYAAYRSGVTWWRKMGAGYTTYAAGAVLIAVPVAILLRRYKNTSSPAGLTSKGRY